MDYKKKIYIKKIIYIRLFGERKGYQIKIVNIFRHTIFYSTCLFHRSTDGFDRILVHIARDHRSLTNGFAMAEIRGQISPAIVTPSRANRLAFAQQCSEEQLRDSIQGGEGKRERKKLRISDCANTTGLSERKKGGCETRKIGERGMKVRQPSGNRVSPI